MSKTKGMIGSASAMFVLLCVAQFLDGMDVSSMGVLLPQIQRTLHMSPQGLQWIVSGYVLGFGGFLVLGGRAADLFGRRRMFLGSLVVFAFAGLVGGLAETGWLLIAARIVKGIAAGFTAPAALALLLGTYKNTAERNRALGIFSAMGAIGFTLGLLIGGFLGAINWRLVLFLPALLAAGVAGIGAIVLKPTQRVTTQRTAFDVAGAVLATSALLLIVLGATEVAIYGWLSTAAAGPLAAGFALLWSFARYEQRIAAPLIAWRKVRVSGARFAGSMGFSLMGCYVAFQFIATLYYQQVVGWSPLQAGLAFIIGGVFMVFGATRFAKLAMRIGALKVIAIGLSIQVFSYLWFLGLFGHIAAVYLAVGQQVIGGIGFAAVYPSVMIQGLTDAADEDHGVISGILISSFQIGGGIILALVASVFALPASSVLAKYRHGLMLIVVFALVAALAAQVRWQRQRSGNALSVPAIADKDSITR